MGIWHTYHVCLVWIDLFCWTSTIFLIILIRWSFSAQNPWDILPSFQISQRYSSDKSNYDHGTSLILDLSVILEQNEALPSWRHSFPYAGYGKVVLPLGRWLGTLRKVEWQRWENGVGSRWQGLELHKGCVCSAHSSHTDCHSQATLWCTASMPATVPVYVWWQAPEWANSSWYASGTHAAGPLQGIFALAQNFLDGMRIV